MDKYSEHLYKRRGGWKKQVILENFPFDIIKDGNFVYIQQTGNRMSILIYDTKNRTLYRLSQVIFLHGELEPYSNYVTVTKEPIFDWHSFNRKKYSKWKRRKRF